MAGEKDQTLGRLAVSRGIISQSQLRACLEEQAKSTRPLPLAVIMLKKGFLDDNDLDALMEASERIAGAKTTSQLNSTPKDETAGNSSAYSDALGSLISSGEHPAARPGRGKPAETPGVGMNVAAMADALDAPAPPRRGQKSEGNSVAGALDALEAAEAAPKAPARGGRPAPDEAPPSRAAEPPPAARKKSDDDGGPAKFERVSTGEGLVTGALLPDLDDDAPPPPPKKVARKVEPEPTPSGKPAPDMAASATRKSDPPATRKKADDGGPAKYDKVSVGEGLVTGALLPDLDDDAPPPPKKARKAEPEEPAAQPGKPAPDMDAAATRKSDPPATKKKDDGGPAKYDKVSVGEGLVTGALLPDLDDDVPPPPKKAARKVEPEPAAAEEAPPVKRGEAAAKDDGGPAKFDRVSVGEGLVTGALLPDLDDDAPAPPPKKVARKVEPAAEDEAPQPPKRATPPRESTEAFLAEAAREATEAAEKTDASPRPPPVDEAPIVRRPGRRPPKEDDRPAEIERVSVTQGLIDQSVLPDLDADEPAPPPKKTAAIEPEAPAPSTRPHFAKVDEPAAPPWAKAPEREPEAEAKKPEPPAPVVEEVKPPTPEPVAKEPEPAPVAKEPEPPPPPTPAPAKETEPAASRPDFEFNLIGPQSDHFKSVSAAAAEGLVPPIENLEPESVEIPVPAPVAAAEPIEEVAPFEEAEQLAEVAPLEEVEPAEEIAPLEEVEPEEDMAPIEEIQPVAEVLPVEDPEPSAEVQPILEVEPDEDLEEAQPIQEVEVEKGEELAEVQPIREAEPAEVQPLATADPVVDERPRGEAVADVVSQSPPEAPAPEPVPTEAKAVEAGAAEDIRMPGWMDDARGLPATAPTPAIAPAPPSSVEVESVRVDEVESADEHPSASPVSTTPSAQDSGGVTEAAPVVEAGPVTETAPATETAPTVEAASVAEAAPVVEEEQVLDAAPVADAAPVTNEASVVESAAVIESTPVTAGTPEAVPGTPDPPPVEATTAAPLADAPVTPPAAEAPAPAPDTQSQDSETPAPVLVDASEPVQAPTDPDAISDPEPVTSMFPPPVFSPVGSAEPAAAPVDDVQSIEEPAPAEGLPATRDFDEVPAHPAPNPGTRPPTPASRVAASSEPEGKPKGRRFFKVAAVFLLLLLSGAAGSIYFLPEAKLRDLMGKLKLPAQAQQVILDMRPKK